MTLANGDPLYGNGAARYLIPMMRTTGVQVDAAGNVWTCNNWKPNFTDDYKGGNPGGAGIVIFVGVATPVGPEGGVCHRPILVRGVDACCRSRVLPVEGVPVLRPQLRDGSMVLRGQPRHGLSS